MLYCQYIYLTHLHICNIIPSNARGYPNVACMLGQRSHGGPRVKKHCFETSCYIGTGTYLHLSEVKHNIIIRAECLINDMYVSDTCTGRELITKSITKPPLSYSVTVFCVEEVELSKTSAGLSLILCVTGGISTLSFPLCPFSFTGMPQPLNH